MPRIVDLARLLRTPSVGAAVTTLVLRAAVVIEGIAYNPMVRQPQLDGWVFLKWGHDIAHGDLLGRAGVVAGEPWFFNPLYAYVMAPFMLGSPVPAETPRVIPPDMLPHLAWILGLQVVLAALTAGLTAAAATRFFGRTAGWIAGLGVAFCGAAAHLDAHIAVASVAGLSMAGAVYAMAPDGPGDDRRRDPVRDRLRGWRGPLATGLWLGIGALARPITPLILPFAALREALRSRRPRFAAVVVALVFGACAVPSFTRNLAVSGEPFLYTGAGGANIWLGNSPAARDYGAMAAADFQFSPQSMHEEARKYVAQRLGRDPTWAEVGTYFRDMAVDEALEHPAEAVGFGLQKLRWFLSPTEVPSSASLALDRRYSRTLWITFVPTWLLGSLALVGLVVYRRRREVLLGPGAVIAAHVAVLTLVFPLSHYRVPAVPAMAVLAGGALAAGLGALRDRRYRQVLAGAALAALLAASGALGRQPNRQESAAEFNLGLAYRDMAFAPTFSGNPPDPELLSLAMATLERAGVLQEQARPGQVMADTYFARGEMLLRARRSEAQTSFREGLRKAPGHWRLRVLYSCSLQMLGRFDEAVGNAERALADSEGHELAARRLAEALMRRGRRGDRENALRVAAYATERGNPPDYGTCGR